MCMNELGKNHRSEHRFQFPPVMSLIPFCLTNIFSSGFFGNKETSRKKRSDYHSSSVADIGEGPGHLLLPPPPPPPLFWVKRKTSPKEEKPAGQVKQNRAPTLAQSLDPPLLFKIYPNKIHLKRGKPQSHVQSLNK